jgi:hypothetical protein
MPIFYKHKLIFHHIPKTAGKAITQWLGPADEHIGHLPIVQLEEIKKNFKKQQLTNVKWGDYTTFTVLREPLDRIRSSFEHIKRSKNVNDQNGFLRNSFLREFTGDFNDFLLSPNLFNIVTSEHAMLLRPMTWMFFEGDARKPKEALCHTPDIVLDFNNLELDCNSMTKKLGLELPKFIAKKTIYKNNMLSARSYKNFKKLWAIDFDIYDFFMDKAHIDKFSQ